MFMPMRYTYTITPIPLHLHTYTITPIPLHLCITHLYTPILLHLCTRRRRRLREHERRADQELCASVERGTRFRCVHFDQSADGLGSEGHRDTVCEHGSPGRRVYAS